MTTSIPLWVPLVVAILGLVGTAGGAISGVLITQRRSDRRENTAWQRERERERDRWTREDAARTFELRRQAYIEFHEAVQRQRGNLQVAYFVQMYEGSPEEQRKPSREIENEVTHALHKVRIYGSDVVVTAALAVKEQLQNTFKILEPKKGKPTAAVPDQDGTRLKHLRAIDAGEAELVRVIRVDLGVPIGDIDKARG